MNSRLPALACLMAMSLAVAVPVSAEQRYVWTDKDGIEHVTREAPGVQTAFQIITVPDNISWRHSPDMPAEVSSDKKLSPQEMFKQTSRSVYWIESRSEEFGRPPRIAFGSAVAISDELALTNCHVVGDGKAALRLGSGKTEIATEVELVAANYDADRCVVKVSGMKLVPVAGVRLVSSVDIGDSVYAIGNPRGLQRTISEGLVSGVRELSDVRLIQTTTPISPGSSGGGLFDDRGNLVGITTLTLSNSQNLNFAVPAEDFWK
jgi:S1-C subfamily serine protease